MKHAGNVLLRHGNKILDDKKYATLCASVFAILPFTFWLSAAIVALITLRKGKEAGFNVLLPAVVASIVHMYTMLPLEWSLVIVLAKWLPVFLGACILRNTMSWPLVFGSFFLLVLAAAILVQILAPQIVLQEYQYFQTWLSSYPELSQLFGKQQNANFWNSEMLAHLFLGIQIALSIFSVILSLLFARFIQAKLFFPGEFKKEITAFRSGKCALLVLASVLFLIWCGVNLAIDVLPLLLLYFLMSGVCLSFVILEKKKIPGLLIFIVSLIVNPAVMIAVCGAFGILDSLFNFRMYFSTRTC